MHEDDGRLPCSANVMNDKERSLKLSDLIRLHRHDCEIPICCVGDISVYKLTTVMHKQRCGNLADTYPVSR